MRRPLLVAGAFLLAGCAALSAAGRRELLQQALAGTVQLRAEAPGGARRAGSGVVVATDRASQRTWILTTRHLLGSAPEERVYVTAPGTVRRARAAVVAMSDESDLLLLVADGVTLPSVTLQGEARLGDAIWVVGYPWGRRLTVLSGIVSQVGASDGEVATVGPPRMVDASVSYGGSGGGVFDTTTGALIAVVEGYRTARVTLQTQPERTVDLPVSGETTVIGVATIRRFLAGAGVEPR